MKKLIKILFASCILGLSMVGCQKNDSTITEPIEEATTTDTVSNDQCTIDDTTAVTSRSTPISGWASATGYNYNGTAIQIALRNAATAANNQSSGQSVTNPYYFTDCDDSDGNRMRNSIQIYHNWYVTPPVKSPCSTPAVPSSILTNMKNALYQGNPNNCTAGYCTAADRDKMVLQIITNYNNWKCANPNSTFNMGYVDTCNELLAFLGIRKQCKEWVNTKVTAAGGTNYTYGNATAVTPQTSYRPGMGLYQYSGGVGQHAMIITDIYWSVASNGTVTAIMFKVGESNWTPDNWDRPNGQIPWQRTVKVGREVAPTSNRKVVNFGGKAYQDNQFMWERVFLSQFSHLCLI